jgi:hypothetical protein
MINRNVIKTVPAFTAVNTVFGTGSTGDVASGAVINGAIVDRLGLGGSTYTNQLRKDDRALVANPFCFAWSTLGSTEATHNVTVECKLQHGDSSGGGDMANLSTDNDASPRTYYSTALTTDMAAWSSGAMYLHSNVADYELSAAKRYLRPVSTVTVGFLATSTIAGPARLYAIQGITFGEFTNAPPSIVSGTTATSS